MKREEGVREGHDQSIGNKTSKKLFYRIEKTSEQSTELFMYILFRQEEDLMMIINLKTDPWKRARVVDIIYSKGE